MAQVPPTPEVVRPGPGPGPGTAPGLAHRAGLRRGPRPAAGAVGAGRHRRVNGRTVERARTALERAFPGAGRLAATQQDFRTDSTSTLAGWQQLANVVMLASLPIAGCSLAVSVAGGLSERKRPFSLLRLTGVPLRVLRRVVTLESAVPLLVVAAVAIGTGLLAADLFLRAQTGLHRCVPPGAEYYVIVGARTARVAGHHRLHAPVAGTHHRPGDRAQRVVDA